MNEEEEDCEEEEQNAGELMDEFEFEGELEILGEDEYEDMRRQDKISLKVC